MNRGLLKFITLTLAIALILIGCQTLLTSQSQAGNPVVLKLGSWGASPAEQTLLRQVLHDFEDQHLGIKIRHEVIADQYMDVLKTRLIGEAAPDVFYLDALEAPFLINKTVLEPLNPYITPEFDLADFEAELLSPFQSQGQSQGQSHGQSQGQIYGLPKDYSTLALFYNKRAFAEAGITAPPQTWDELRAYSKRLTLDRNQDGRTDQYGFGVVPELARQAFKIKAYGGEIVDANGNAAFASRAGIQGLQTVIDQYRGDRTAAQKSDVGTNSGSEMFGQGRVAMVLDGNWAIPYLEETFPALEFGTAEVPTINGQSGTMMFTVAYVMNRQTPHKSEAWELISYLTGKEGMEKWTGTGFALPTRRSVAERLGYDQEPLRSAFVAGVEYATPWQAGAHPAAVVNNFDNQFISALLGEQPLPQAIRRAQESANREIRHAS